VGEGGGVEGGGVAGGAGGGRVVDVDASGWVGVSVGLGLLHSPEIAADVG